MKKRSVVAARSAAGAASDLTGCDVCLSEYWTDAWPTVDPLGP